MNELVSREAFIKATHLDRWNLTMAAKPLMKLSGIAKMNEVYGEIRQLSGGEFIDAFLKKLQINIEIEGKGLDKIPKKGAFVVVANHPYGMIDSLVLLHLIGQRRPDIKLFSNQLLAQADQIAPLLLSDPEEMEQEAMLHLEAGGCVAVFPAGEVSSFRVKDKGIADRAWNKSTIKLIRKVAVPVIPVYFEGGNSTLFQLLSMVSPKLQSAVIPWETLKMSHTTLPVRIGSPISMREQKKVSGADRFGRYLRARVYSLGSGLEVQPFFRPVLSFPSKQKEIARPIRKEFLLPEIERLRKAGGVVCEQGEFEVMVGRAAQIPYVLQEVGRLREVTFRTAGEGTGLARDLDEYDLYYHHLFLWDKEEQQIAGAYRMGPGDEIAAKFGKRGFYIFSLFKMKKAMLPMLEQSVELGRSFILEDYQKKRLPLFLLWKGIRQFLYRHEQYRYLIGPVSISNDYSQQSRSFMVAFIQAYFFDHALAAHIKPRKRFKPSFNKVDIHDLLEGTQADLKMADRLVDEMEPRHARLPILLKKYIKQNARIIGFNIDPKFMNALDGLIVLDIQELPEEAENMYG